MKESGDQKDDKKDTSVVPFKLNASASNMFVAMVSFLPQLISSIVAIAKPKKFEYFSHLSEEIKRDAIASYLNPVEKRNFALAYKKNLCLIKPILDITHFQTCVARGQQSEAQRLLQESKTKNNGDNPNLLLAVETFTDYSGRTFTCTAYEYAYWAKDRHMLRMLEALMDEPTKEAMSSRIDTLEQQGLTYWQHGKAIQGSKHFDITPLKTAYEDYIRTYSAWEQANFPLASLNAHSLLQEAYFPDAPCPAASRRGVMAAWMQVGKAQRDLPVHYVNEYFRKDRLFHPTPAFNEDVLPRDLIFDNWVSCKNNERLFPLVLTGSAGLPVDIENGVDFENHERLYPLDLTSAGLGVDFAFLRGAEPAVMCARGASWGGGSVIERWDSRGAWTDANVEDVFTIAALDLATVCHLDEVRTNDLMQSRKNLEPTAPTPGMSL